MSRRLATLLGRAARFMLGTLGSLCLAAVASAQQQYQGVCANVKIEILQELAFERIGFEATLEITNNAGGDPITDFSAALTFHDPKDLDNGQPRDVSDRFFVQRARLTDINSIDGAGVIGPTRTAIIRWFIIPKTGAGGILPQGKVYEVGVNLAGKMGGEPIPSSILYAIPDNITVRPEPELEIRYFQPRDVQGDDPFTPEVEAPIPFTLGVLVKNAGYGVAKSVRINSQQPRIVENQSGLVLIARLLGARVQDSALDETSLSVNLGDISPGVTRKGAWDMITSLSGEFIEFKASYTHRDDLGGLETSLIKTLEAHFIAHEVLNDRPGQDRILDFLADTDRDPLQLPDTLYGSEGEILPVNNETDASITSPLAERTFEITVNRQFSDWGYVRLTDPGQAKLEIASVVRQDGKRIHLRNRWTNIRYRQSDNAKLTYFNLLDHVDAPGTYRYTVTYAEPAVDNDPPVTRLRFVGQVTHQGGNYYITRETELYFTAEDASPVSIEYQLDDDTEFRPAVPFKISTPGAHLVRYRARDTAGNVEETKTAAVIVEGDGPAFGDIEVLSDALTVTGDSLSFRSTQVAFTIPVAESNVAVGAEIDVFRGVRVWPTVTGVPVSPTPATQAALAVSGTHVDFYKYRVNGGAWSAERAVSAPIALESLSGTVTVEILARAQVGGYPPAGEALRVSWEVHPDAVPYALAGLPAVPTRHAFSALTVQATGIERFRWTINDDYWRAEANPGTDIELPALNAGTQTLKFIARRSGTWQDETKASTWTWVLDRAYGSNLDSLPRVHREVHENVQGSTLNFTWDGRDTNGTPQLPGWYTVRIRLTDALGHVAFQTRLVRIDDFVATTEALSSTGTGAEKPDARGGWVVWQDRSSGTTNIRARQLNGVDGAVLNITQSSLSQENPRTDGVHAVWQGRRANSNWDIFFVDLTDPTHVVEVTDSPTKNDINPVIDWPWIVWQRKDTETPNAPWQLQAANLETGQLFTVDPTSNDQLDPAVRAGRVVWQDFRDVGPGEIYFRDLETGEQRRLTHNTAGQYAPDIDGHWVVWQDNRHTQVDLYGYDLRRNAETQLTHTTANEARPRIVGNWVLFTSDVAGTLTENFFLLDLGTRRALPLTRSATRKGFGGLAGGQLVWQEGASPQSSVIAAAVPALQPVFRNSNAVVITPALAEKYGSAFALLAAWNEQAGVTSVSRFESFTPLVQQTAIRAGSGAAGTDFTLTPGDFVWVRFHSEQLLELGAASGEPVNLPAGISALTHTQLPHGLTGHALVQSLGLSKVRGLRLLDAAAGEWRVLVVENGQVAGADFAVPNVAVLLIDLSEAIHNWTP